MRCEDHEARIENGLHLEERRKIINRDGHSRIKLYVDLLNILAPLRRIAIPSTDPG